MKQVTFENASGEVRVVDVPPPDVPDRGVLVATRASVVSAGTERMLIQTGAKSLAGKARARPDLVRKVVETARRDGLVQTYRFVRKRLDESTPVGYSLAGEVLATGPLGGPFRPGDRVACAGAQHAFHAAQVAVPRNLAARVPDAVSDEAAAYATVGAIALQGLRRAEATVGEVVVVVGLGLVGQLAAQLAAAAGCVVLGTDLDLAKCELASRASGARAASSVEALAAMLDEASRGRGADAVLLCAATDSDEPIALAARLARDRGRVVVVGDVGMRLARAPFYDKELDLRLSRSYGPGRHDASYEEAGIDYPIGYVRWTEGRNLEAFLDLCAAGRIDPSALTTHRFPVEDAAAAYQTLREGREFAVGIVLRYGAEVSPVAPPAPPVPAARRLVRDVPEVAFVGIGNFAVRTLVPAFTSAGAKLGAVASQKGLSANHAVAKHGFARAVSGLGDAIATEPDAVVVATRHDTHAAHVIAAARAGQAIFVEKPLCLYEEDLEEIVRAVAEGGAYCFTGFNRRYAPFTTQALEHLAAAPGPRQVLIRVNAGVLDGHWLADPEVGGGRWVGEGCHFADLAIALAGSEPTFVTASAVGGASREAGSMHATVEFADGSTATIVYLDAGDPAGGKELVEVHAGGRSAIIDDFRTLTLVAGGKTTAHKARQDKGHRAEVRAFLEAVRAQATGFSPGSLEAMRLTFAALDAACVGGRVALARAGS